MLEFAEFYIGYIRFFNGARILDSRIHDSKKAAPGSDSQLA